MTSSTPLTLEPETPARSAGADALIERAFGPGRLVKVSERVRECARFRPDLSVLAFDDGVLVGVARMWDIAIGGTRLAFLGPLAVEASARKSGAGAALVNAAAQGARADGACAVLLVGDMAYFGRLGFRADLAAGAVLPGPVDQNRVLLRWLAPGAPKALSGPLSAPTP
jgi:predicted N-acetyltransferase YhbS